MKTLFILAAVAALVVIERIAPIPINQAIDGNFLKDGQPEYIEAVQEMSVEDECEVIEDGWIETIRRRRLRRQSRFS